MYLRSVYVLREGRNARVVVTIGMGTFSESEQVPFNVSTSASHIELARRACRMVGGTPLQRQVTRSKVKGVWIAPDEVSPVRATGQNATQEDEHNGK